MSSRYHQGMMHRVDDLLGCAVHGTDGEFGRVHDVYFDDQRLVACYVVVDTRHGRPGRKVLLAPAAVRGADWDHRSLDVTLGREQIGRSPDAQTHRPVGQQNALTFRECYTLPYSWALGGFLRAAAFPARGRPREAHLRSIRLVRGYRVEAVDGTVGHLDGFLIDDLAWALEYAIVKTHHWWPSRRVLVPTERIARVSWLERTVHVDLTLETILSSPAFDPSRALGTRDIARLAAFYGESPGASLTQATPRSSSP